MKLGTTFKYTASDNVPVTLQVLQHKSTGSAEAVDVRLCNLSNVAIDATRRPWVLLYNGGDSEHNIDISGGGLPAPAYPRSFDPKTLTPGKCVQGWINYSLIAGKKPYGIAYNNEGNRLVWKF